MTTPDTIARLTAEPAGEDVERVARGVLPPCGCGDDTFIRTDGKGAWVECCNCGSKSKPQALHATDHIPDARKMVPTDDLRRTREAEAVELIRPLVEQLDEAEASFPGDDIDGPLTDDDATCIRLGLLRPLRTFLSTVSKAPSA